MKIRWSGYYHAVEHTWEPISQVNEDIHRMSDVHLHTAGDQNLKGHIIDVYFYSKYYISRDTVTCR